TLLLQGFDHLVDVLVSHFRLLSLNFKLAEFAELDLGIHFKGGNEFQVLAFFQRLGLDTRLACRLQLLLGDGIVVGPAHYFAHDFLADTRTKAALDDAHRHLALAEAIQAYLAGSLLQTSSNSTPDNGSAHPARHATLKASGGFNRNLHEISSYLNEMPSSRRLSS